MRSSLTTHELVNCLSEPSTPVGGRLAPVDVWRGRVRAGAWPKPVSVTRPGLGAEVARLAGWSGPAHQQGRLMHLTVGEGRSAQGHHDRGHEEGDVGASHGLARTSPGGHSAPPDHPFWKATSCPRTQFEPSWRDWRDLIILVLRGRCRRALGHLGIISPEQQIAALEADLPAFERLRAVAMGGGRVAWGDVA